MTESLFSVLRVVVRGGGDLASGVIYRLVRAGFPVIVLELETPLLVRRTVAYGDAVFSSVRTVDGVTARLTAGSDEALAVLSAGDVPVLIDPAGASLAVLQPAVLVDARMEKRNLGTTLNDAPLVIALGPGFTAGVDCHAVIETNRGHNLGRVYWQGMAEPDTGEPGAMAGHTHSRVLRAPADGYVIAHAEIGDSIHKGQIIAEVAGQPVIAAFDGVLRGLIHPRVPVHAGMKIGDLDPRAVREHCFTISDKSLAVGGGALQAVMESPLMRGHVAARLAKLC